jgi:hypothetical protein
MRWKGLERLIRMGLVSAQGDAVFLAFSRRGNPTKPYLGSKINRVAGRVVKKAFASGTIDVLMMRIPTYSARLSVCLSVCLSVYKWRFRSAG